MAGIDAAADLGVVVLDRLGDRFDLVVAVAGTVVVDADGDVELLDQLVQIVEAGGIGIGGKILNAQGLGELEDAAVGVGVVAEVDDAVADDGHAGPLDLLLSDCEGSRTGIHRARGPGTTPSNESPAPWSRPGLSPGRAGRRLVRPRSE